MDVAALQLNEIPFQFFEFFFSFCFSRWVPLFLGVFPAYSDSSLLKCYFHGCWSTKPCSLYFIWSMQLHFTFNRMCVEFVCVNSNNFFSSVSKCVKHSQDVLVFDGDEEKTKKINTDLLCASNVLFRPRVRFSIEVFALVVEWASRLVRILYSNI